jgi:hypothetical protein
MTGRTTWRRGGTGKGKLGEAAAWPPWRSRLSTQLLREANLKSQMVRIPCFVQRVIPSSGVSPSPLKRSSVSGESSEDEEPGALGHNGLTLAQRKSRAIVSRLAERLSGLNIGTDRLQIAGGAASLSTTSEELAWHGVGVEGTLVGDVVGGRMRGVRTR